MVYLYAIVAGPLTCSADGSPFESERIGSNLDTSSPLPPGCSWR
jgi:hypothetical protein